MANLLNYLIPEDMQNYLSYYGYHFNKALCDYAVSKMEKEDKETGIAKKLTPITMDELKAMLSKHKVQVEDKEVYDALYLANMIKADYLGNSIEDEAHMVKHIEDILCDVDGYEGKPFVHYLSDCSGKGEVIFWNMFI